MSKPKTPPATDVATRPWPSASSGRRWELALLAALIVHGGSLALLSLSTPADLANSSSRATAPPATIEVALEAAPTLSQSVAPTLKEPKPRDEARARESNTASPQENAPSVAGVRATSSDAGSVASNGEANATGDEALAAELLVSRNPANATPGSADVEQNGGFPRALPPGRAKPNGSTRHIDLGLDGSVRRDTLLALRDAPRPENERSAGLLKEGLDARDAKRGMARSGPAVHAGYEAARRLAPPTGIAVFDVLSDERGVVLSVSLVSSGSDEARWRAVGEDLSRALRGRRVRVPPDAKGLLTRLRIERGQLAVSLGERDSTPRAAAVGQGAGDRSLGTSESNHELFKPGVLTPTLGTKFEHKAHPTRIVVVFEKAL